MQLITKKQNKKMKKLILVIAMFLTISAICQTSTSTSSSALTGTGTVNYLSKYKASKKLGNSQILDNGTYVGLGTPIPSALLHIQGITTAGETIFKVNDGYGSNICRFIVGSHGNFGQKILFGDYTTVPDAQIEIKCNSNTQNQFLNFTNSVAGGKTYSFGIIAGSNNFRIWDGGDRLIIKSNTINLVNLPTSSAGLVTGDLYIDAGVLKVK